jgi:hypothetical protein
MNASEDIRDIHGPIALPHGHPLWIYLAIGAGVVGIVITAIVLLRRRQRPVSPDVMALRALEALRPLIASGEVSAFSSQVSDAVRHYVEVAFAVRAPRRTTEELLSDLMVDGSPVAAHRDSLGEFLSCCDLVKYARSNLSRLQMSQLLESAESFIRSTARSPSGALS